MKTRIGVLTSGGDCPGLNAVLRGVVLAARHRFTRARVALGGVGTKPWRSPEAEAALAGQAATPANFRKAVEAALHDAKPQSENGFKIELAKRCLTHALQMAATG